VRSLGDVLIRCATTAWLCVVALELGQARQLAAEVQDHLRRGQLLLLRLSHAVALLDQGIRFSCLPRCAVGLRLAQQERQLG